jgi:phage baseplate assembly protein W
MSTYVDINTYYGVVEDVNLLALDDDAILNGFLNILNTIKDQDGISEKPFRPNSGSSLYQLLQEPLDETTVFKIRMALEDAAKQLTRATIDLKQSVVQVNRDKGCFEIQLVLTNSITNKSITGFFNLAKG